MFLTLKNIGKINFAEIEIKGLTVLAGENNTGKSTFGKVLFSVFNSFQHITEKVYEERIQRIDRIIGSVIPNSYFLHEISSDSFPSSIIKDSEKYINSEGLLVDELDQYYASLGEKKVDSSELKKGAERILEILEVSDDVIFRTVLTKKLNEEFHGQINNIYSDDPGYVCLGIKDADIEVKVVKNEVESITGKIDLKTDAIYIDDPFVLDELNFPAFYRSSDHKKHLRRKLQRPAEKDQIEEAINEILVDKKLDLIMKKINPICGGTIGKSGRKIIYNKDENASLDIANISTGLKTFIILKLLLQNGSITENGMIILDEPEIHLHPKWQLVFAEIIVLMYKCFNLRILLNTHSPYFLNAIEVYSVKHGIKEKCRYYLAEEDDLQVSVTNVTQNLEKIYEKLAQPLQELENESYEHD